MIQIMYLFMEQGSYELIRLYRKLKKQQGGLSMEDDKERKPYGYLLQYENTQTLGETFDALRKLADDQDMRVEITYQKSMIQFFQVSFGTGAHDESLEEKLKAIPNIIHVERDYLEKKI